MEGNTHITGCGCICGCLCMCVTLSARSVKPGEPPNQIWDWCSLEVKVQPVQSVWVPFSSTIATLYWYSLDGATTCCWCCKHGYGWVWLCWSVADVLFKVLCWCAVLFRLVLCQMSDTRLVLEDKPEFHSAWKSMAQMLMSTFERRYWTHTPF